MHNYFYFIYYFFIYLYACYGRCRVELVALTWKMSKIARKVIWQLCNISVRSDLFCLIYSVQYKEELPQTDTRTVEQADRANSSPLMILIHNIYTLWARRCLLKCCQSTLCKVYPLQGYKYRFQSYLNTFL